MRDLPPDKLQKLRNDVIALEAAAALAYDHVYGGNAKDETPTWGPTDVCSAIAHAMATVTRLYVASADKTSFRQLMQDDLRGGLFDDAGAVLRFPDGRPEISGICVQSSVLAETIVQLKQLRSLLDEVAADYSTRGRR